ncbi:hypothetical protein Tco_1118063 [Tanacetum coccineum]
MNTSHDKCLGRSTSFTTQSRQSDKILNVFARHGYRPSFEKIFEHSKLRLSLFTLTLSRLVTLEGNPLVKGQSGLINIIIGTNGFLGVIPSILINYVIDVAFHSFIGIQLRSMRGRCTMFENSEVDVGLLKDLKMGKIKRIDEQCGGLYYFEIENQEKGVDIANEISNGNNVSSTHDNSGHTLANEDKIVATYKEVNNETGGGDGSNSNTNTQEFKI